MDFSFLGLQLTLQYILPILIGIVASGFSYNYDNLNWFFKRFMNLCIAIFILFVLAYFFRIGHGPSSATSVMLFSFTVSLLSALYFIMKQSKYLWYIIILFLIPFFELTRTGIAATAAVFVLHFANGNIRSKIIFGIVGVMVLFIIFNTKRFQEETFKGGSGTINDITFNYYENPKIKSSGRVTWKLALEPGLKASPVWGNGPRADNKPITKITRLRYGEAHNDYMAVRYNYGYVGLSLLLTGFFLTFVSLYRISRKYKRNDIIWLLSTSALTLFISFLMFMYTDNILKYTIYFPDYFFALIGAVYSLKKDEDLSSYTVVQ